jgi:hypothetical protein
VAVAVLRVLFRAEFRHRWQSWLMLTLLIGLVSGPVLAGVVAARRTATAFPTFEVGRRSGTGGRPLATGGLLRTA